MLSSTERNSRSEYIHPHLATAPRRYAAFTHYVANVHVGGSGTALSYLARIINEAAMAAHATVLVNDIDTFFTIFDII
jgi:hypothetical protein